MKGVLTSGSKSLTDRAEEKEKEELNQLEELYSEYQDSRRGADKWTEILAWLYFDGFIAFILYLHFTEQDVRAVLANYWWVLFILAVLLVLVSALIRKLIFDDLRKEYKHVDIEKMAENSAKAMYLKERLRLK